MGFFDKLIKDNAKQLVSNTIDGGLNNIKNSKKHNDKDSIHKKLTTLFEEEFSEYEIRKDIPAQEFFAQDGAQNYTYGMYLNGEPKAMIMIIDGNNDYRRASVVKARTACADMHIPYMNFMSYMANHYDYVSERLHESVH